MKDEYTSTADINIERGKNQSSAQLVKDINFFSKDFLFFKNDILKEIKNLESKIELQKRYNNDFKSAFNNYDSKIEKLNEKIDNLTTIINNKEAETNYYNEKIAIIMEFKTQIENEYYTINNKVKVNAAELRNAINKYDKVIYDNLEYPGVIGKDSRFSNFHEYIDFTLNQIKNFGIFKDKNIVDFKSYKNKLDSMVNSLNYQIQNILSSANSFTTESKKELEKKLMNEIKLFDEKFIKLRVENMETIKSLEDEKKQIFEEWGNFKNMKKELTELVESSLKKVNNSNNSMKKNLENYERQFLEIKNNVSSITNIYNKFKSENIESDENRNFIKNKDFNSTKSDYYKNNDKNNFVKRTQSAKSNLLEYIEGNSIYSDLIRRNSERCKQHDYDETKIKLMTLRKYYDEGINNIKNISTYKIINDIMNKNNISLTERNRSHEKMNNTPKTNINSNKMMKKFEEYHQDDLNSKKENLGFSKSRKNSSNRKFILLKEGGNDINTKNTKVKPRDIEKRLQEADKFIDQFVDKNRISKLKQLSSISFLYDDIKQKKNKFPKIDNVENNKEDELFLKSYKKIIKKKHFQNLKFKDYNVLEGFRQSDNNINNNNQKIPKRQRINSSEIMKHYYNKEKGDDNSSNLFNFNNENNSESGKKINKTFKKSKKSGEFNKHSLFKLKSEINNK